jgi:hypothetical protein
MDEAGVVDALVATLEHESPFCVAAAAGCLGSIGDIEGGQAVLDASRAIPALVRVINRQFPANGLDGEMPMFRRSAPDVCVL